MLVVRIPRPAVNSLRCSERERGRQREEWKRKRQREREEKEDRGREEKRREEKRREEKRRGEKRREEKIREEKGREEKRREDKKGSLGVRIPKLRYLEQLPLACRPAANSLDSGIDSVSRIDIMNWINFVWGPRAGIMSYGSCYVPTCDGLSLIRF